MYVRIFGIAFLISVLLVPLVGKLATRLKLNRQPRSNRWNKRLVPHFGGVAIYIAIVITVLLVTELDSLTKSILIGATLVFLLGLVDDIRTISPQTKLAGIIISAAFLIFAGNVLHFTPWPVVNIFISFFWIIGLANAINLVDNVDGLAAGLSLVASGFLAFFFLRSGDIQLLSLTIAIAGATLGFLVYNKPPASIFMGDGGSLFLGIILGTLAIARQTQASNIFAVISVPLLIFMIPIIDTSMVFITRLLRGQSPAEGGRDHTSHRLIILGLGEWQALILLLVLAIFSGLSAVLLEEWSYSLSLILLPVVIVSLGLFGAYLGQSKLHSNVDVKAKTSKMSLFIAGLTFKRRIFEIFLDIFIIVSVYYFSFVIIFGIPLDAENWSFFLSSVPIIVGVSFFSFLLLGIYRGIWRYLGLEDIVRIGAATFTAAALNMLAIRVIFSSEANLGSYVQFFIFLIVLFLIVVLSRLSFRLLDRLIDYQNTSNGPMVPVLIYGAGDAGEMVLRECKRNKKLGYSPVGFIDDNKAKHGRSLNGLLILGGKTELIQIITKTNTKGLIISTREVDIHSLPKEVTNYLLSNGIWVKNLQLFFLDQALKQGR